jgi:hypothetical protein
MKASYISYSDMIYQNIFLAKFGVNVVDLESRRLKIFLSTQTALDAGQPPSYSDAINMPSCSEYSTFTSPVQLALNNARQALQLAALTNQDAWNRW